MDPISSLIFHALTNRQGVILPGIGALYVTVAPAVMRTPGTILPPENRVELTSEQNTSLPHIFTLIAEQRRINLEQAQEIYYQWLAGVCSERGVTITSVGSIVEGVFTPDPTLLGVLNPGKIEPVKLPAQVDSKQIGWWIAGGVVAGIVIAAGLITLLELNNGSKDPAEHFFAPTPHENVAPATPQAVTPPATDSMPITDSTQTPAAAATQDTSASVAPQAPAVSASSVAAPASQTLYYVVVGTYSNMENADKFIREAQRIDASLTYTKRTQPSSRVVVSVFHSPIQSEASQFQHKIADKFTDAWVLKVKP
ncbi:MAG: SPOR domain-containing protein [Alistipes sp.]|nr:SPOR domain-containing protein [Alistipes sp.]